MALLAAALPTLALVACGAPMPPREPTAESVAPAAYPQQPQQPQQAYPAGPAPQPTQPGAVAPAPIPGLPGTPGTPARSERVRAFYQHGVELEQAAADCKSACRALGAMDRAAGELCEIDGRDGICKDAEGRVRAARDKVRGACGTCPDGVILERDAPVPGQR